MSLTNTPTTMGGKAWQSGRNTEHFPDPFCDMSSLAMPTTIQDALRWCEYILVSNGPYREALNRVISYFLTDVEIISASGDQDKIGREEKQKYEDFLNDTIGIRNVLHTVALDFMAYGNSFTSLLVPFRRYLACPQCGFEAPLKRVFNTSEFAFAWNNFDFHANCPQCQHAGRWRHVDRRSGEKNAIKVKRWSPHEIDILHDPYTDDCSYIWKIPDDYRQLVKKGHLYHLERSSWEIIQAVKNNKHLLFDDDVIYHMKEMPLAGLRSRGWGYSRVLTNFRQAWLYQVLHRYNEAICMDYIIPFRVITPMPRPGQGGEVNDPVLSINMGSFVARVNSMLRARRRDPARWNVLPFPIEYKALGGDATQLAPKELLELAMDMLLTACGVPIELYKGNLTAQAAPAALRLFEANWSHLTHNLNRFLQKLVEKISQIMSWEPVTARLIRVTHADDMNRQMAKLQLMMGGQISKTTGLASVGMEFLEEERRKLEEERIAAEEAQKQQEEMDQMSQMDQMAAPQQQGAPGGDPSQMQQGAPGAMPGAPQPMGPMGVPPGPQGAQQQFAAQMGEEPTDTPEALQQKAQTLASQVMAMPESQKDSFLIRLKRQSPTLHALVRSIVEDTKRQAEVQAGAQAIAQQYGKQGSYDPGAAMRKLAEDQGREVWRGAWRQHYGKELRLIEV